MWTLAWDTCAIDWLQVQNSSVLFYCTLQLTNWLTSFPYSFFFVHYVSLSLGFMSAFQLQWKTLSPIWLHCLANRTHNHDLKEPSLAALDSPWMFNSSLQFLRRKLNAHCVWTPSIIPRLCHVFTLSVLSVLTNTQILQEDGYKRQSNVRFARHLSKFLKETRSRICLHLIISTDWWIFSL